MRRTYTKDYNEEPEQVKFDIPSEKEHLLQINDIYTIEDEMGQKLKLDNDSVSIKLEVVGGDEEGRSLLQRLTLDENSKGFFATRLLLKALGMDYKGKGLTIDTDLWVGLQLYATVIHNGKYVNINEYNFEKKIEQKHRAGIDPIEPKDIAWDN